MKTHLVRLLIFALAAFALLNWIQSPTLTLWQLSIVSSQRGLWFALLVSVLLIVFLIVRTRKRRLDSLFIALAYFAFISFLAPLFTALRVETRWRTEVAQAFGGAVPPRDWWSLSRDLIGRQTPPTVMVRSSFLSAAGTALNLDRYPARGASTPAPWILVVHGCGWDSGNSEQLPELNHHLSSLGYTVISIDYRLVPMARWPAQRDDVLEAIKAIKAHAAEWNLDPVRWVILGRSAGGQIAGAVAYSLQGLERPQGLISFYAPTDLTFGYEIGEENDILKSRSLIRAFIGAPPGQLPDLYRSSSLIELATARSCPTLLLHGQRDTLVSVRHTERLMTRLKSLGVKSAAVILPWGPHGFDYFLNGSEGQISTGAVEFFLERVLPVPST